jgi:hypothetical protein
MGGGAGVRAADGRRCRVTKWEKLESWFIGEIERRGLADDHWQFTFTSRELADSLGISYSSASWLIQSYLSAQRTGRSQTLFVLKRQGRTTKAVWSAGERSQDARERLDSFAKDAVRTIERALEPDLLRIVEINPRAKHAVAVCRATIRASLVALGVALDDDGSGD